MTLSPAREATRRECLVDAAVREVSEHQAGETFFFPRELRDVWTRGITEWTARLIRDRFIANGHAADCLSHQRLNSLGAERWPCDCGYYERRPPPSNND